MKKVTIDLNNDSIVDLTIDELKKLQTMVNDSIQIYNSKAKNKKPVQGTLFGSKETISEIKTTFEKSNVYQWQIFEKELLELEQMGIDILFYYNCVKDWSFQKPNIKRTSKGWIATARIFIRSAVERKQVKMIDNLLKEQVSVESMLEYLNM